MSSENEMTSGGGDREPEDLVALFARQEEPSPGDFILKLRRRIHRRSASVQLATFTWELPKSVLVQFLHLIQELFFAFGSHKEKKP